LTARTESLKNLAAQRCGAQLGDSGKVTATRAQDKPDAGKQ
jgi:hypothetical protein